MGARALARIAWAAQDAMFDLGPGVLVREQEFELTGARPPRTGLGLATRTSVVSAETWPWRPHGTVTELVVVTELVRRDGTVVALSRLTSLLAA